MRLIDADELRTKMCHAKDIAKQDGELMVIGAGYLFGAPTIDAVPVVRCKDCKYFEVDSGLKYGALCLHHGHRFSVPKPDDFCSYGKKMDEGEAK